MYILSERQTPSQGFIFFNRESILNPIERLPFYLAFVILLCAVIPIAKAEAPVSNYITYLPSENLCENTKPYASDVATVQLYKQTTQDSEELRLNYWLYKLMTCESGGKKNAVGDLDLDEPAFGLFQYRKSSYLKYARKYNIYPQDWTDEQIKNDVYNESKQIELTKLVLTKESWRPWYNCSLKIGLNKVEF